MRAPQLFNPPSVPTVSGDLNRRVKDFFVYFENFRQYLMNYLNVRLFDQLSPFQSIASAATILPLQRIQPVNGTVTVQTISTADDFGFEVMLLAVDGFSLGTTGNIAVAKTLSAGQAVALYKNLLNSKWYPT